MEWRRFVTYLWNDPRSSALYCQGSWCVRLLLSCHVLPGCCKGCIQISVGLNQPRGMVPII